VGSADLLQLDQIAIAFIGCLALCEQIAQLIASGNQCFAQGRLARECDEAITIRGQAHAAQELAAFAAMLVEHGHQRLFLRQDIFHLEHVAAMQDQRFSLEQAQQLLCRDDIVSDQLKQSSVLHRMLWFLSVHNSSASFSGYC